MAKEQSRVILSPVLKTKTKPVEGAYQFSRKQYPPFGSSPRSVGGQVRRGKAHIPEVTSISTTAFLESPFVDDFVSAESVDPSRTVEDLAYPPVSGLQEDQRFDLRTACFPLSLMDERLQFG